MPSDRIILNQYLFLEFGLESDVEPPPVSEDWPFRLAEAGTIRHTSASYTFYSFTHNGTPYWAFASPTYLGCEPRAGMSFEDLVVKECGGAWIQARDPIDLETTRIGDERVPRTSERRAALESLALAVPGEDPPRILIGFFLAKCSRYLALAQRGASEPACVVGAGLTPIPVGFPDATPAQRLAYGVGVLLQSGQIRE